MKESKLHNTALFVAREYDGKHIGPQRFDSIIDAAKKAVNRKPYNAVTEDYQFSWPKYERGKHSARGKGSRSGTTKLKHVDDMEPDEFSTASDEGEEREMDSKIQFNKTLKEDKRKNWASMSDSFEKGTHNEIIVVAEYGTRDSHNMTVS